MCLEGREAGRQAGRENENGERKIPQADQINLACLSWRRPWTLKFQFGTS